MDVKTEDVNYVILQDNGKPIVWETDGMPVIYGGIVDAEMDLREEDGEKIITLGEYAKNIGIDWRLFIDNDDIPALEKLHIFLSDKEDNCYAFGEDKVEFPMFNNSKILSVYDDGENLKLGFDVGGILFQDDVTEIIAEFLMAEIMKEIYPR